MDDIDARESIDALRLFATDEQQRRWMPLLKGGSRVAFAVSEPDAGSDVGAIVTKAVRDGDEFVLDGQKKYIAAAADADYLWMVVRTSRGGPRHSGLTTLIVPRDTPGMEVVPILDLAGRHSADKVYLAGARVPIANVIGEVGHGWFQAASGVTNALYASRVTGELEHLISELLELARTSPLSPGQRQGVTECYVRASVARELVRSAGNEPRLESGYRTTSALLFANETLQQAASALSKLAGLRGAVLLESNESPASRYLAASYATIAHGTSELLRDDIAARLGLPVD